MHIHTHTYKLFSLLLTMNFILLPSNPNRKTKFVDPFLLEDMEKQQFVHSKTSPFTVKHPKDLPLKNAFKKPRYIPRNPSIPLYQSSKYQIPYSPFPRPRKHYMPKVYSRRNLYKPKPITAYTSVHHPILINVSESKKFMEMSKNVQTGVSIQLHGQIDEIIRNASWEGLVAHLGKKYFIHLMGEFYCNMRVTKGMNGELHFTTVLNRKPILVDQRTINKALHLPTRLSEKPCVDIYSYFVFDKAEFELMLGILCDSDVPVGLYNANCGIHYKHFSPKFQFLALMLRANVMPKPNLNKHFDFFDVKLLYLLESNKIDFSISYVILLNMVNARLVDYMPYGLLLTSLFDIYHIPMPPSACNTADSHITPAHIRAKVPLIYCEPQVIIPFTLPNEIIEEDISLANYESARIMFEEQKFELRRIKQENLEIKERLNYLEGLASTMGANSAVDMEIMSSFEVPTMDNAMITDIENIGVTETGEGSARVPDFVGENGFVAYLEDPMV